MNITDKMYDKLSNKAVNAIKKGSYRWVDLINNQFPHPKIPNKRIKLGPYQIDFIDTIQFGYPIRRLRSKDVKMKPSGVIYITRRQVGKSVNCGNAAAAGMIVGPGFGNTPPCFNGIIAASEEESKLLIDKVKYNIENSDFNDFISGKVKATVIDLINGSSTRSHTCSHRSIRGPSYHYVYIDESAQMEESVLFSAAIPTVEHGERWIAITTPQGGKGKLMKHYMKSVATRPLICVKCGKQYSQRDFKANFPVKNKIWEMPKLSPCKKCKSEKYKYGVGIFATPWLNPWKTPIIDQEKLKRELDTFDWSPWVRQEKLGEILDEASMVILRKWIDKNTNKRLKNKMRLIEGAKYVIGMDYGRIHDASSWCVMHLNKNNRKVLDYIRTVSGEFDYQTDYHAIHDHMKEIVSFYKPVLLVIDGTGAGQPQMENVQRDVRFWSPRTKLYMNSKKSLGFIISKKTKPELIDNLSVELSMNPPQLEIPPNTEEEIEHLTAELLNFGCEINDKTGYINYGTQSYHDDRVIAFALALWGFRGKHSYRTKPRGVVLNPFGGKSRENYGYGKKNSTAKAVHYGF